MTQFLDGLLREVTWLNGDVEKAAAYPSSYDYGIVGAYTYSPGAGSEAGFSVDSSQPDAYGSYSTDGIRIRTYYNLTGQAYKTVRLEYVVDHDVEYPLEQTQYDHAGRPEYSSGTDLKKTRIEYSPVTGEISKVTEPGGRTTAYESGWVKQADSGLDVFQSKTTIQDSVDGDTVLIDQVDRTGDHAWSSVNGLVTRTDFTRQGTGGGTLVTTGPDGSTLTETYTGRLLSSAESRGPTDPIETVTYGYDSRNRMTSVTDAFGTTSYTLAENGMVDVVTLPAVNGPGARTIEVLDRDEKTYIPTQVRRADATIVEQRVNSRGEVVGVQGAGEIATLIDINPHTGNVTGLKTFASGSLDEGNAAVTNWDYYGSTGQVKSKTYAGETSAAWSLDYDLKDRVETIHSGDLTATVAYDDATDGTGLFKSQTWDTGLSREVLSRDAKNRVHELKLKTSASDPGLTFSWDYNADNQLTRESLPQLGGTWGMEWGYYPKTGYGEDGAPAALASVSIRDTLDQTLARVNYTYDPATKRLETITADLPEGQGFAADAAFTYTYTSDSNRIATITNNVTGVVSTYDYESGSGRLLSITTMLGEVVLYRVEYDFFADDQRQNAEVTRSVPGGSGLPTQVTWTYAYDAGDQLETATAVSGQTPLHTFDYDFDGIGNYTEAGWVYNTANQLTAMPGRDGNFNYDSRGNLLDDKLFAYTWDAENHLLSATPLLPGIGDHKLSFTYDPQGRRISKQVETYDGSAWSVSQTLTFAYDGWNLLAEYESVGAAKRLLRSFAWGLSLGGGVSGLLSITTYAYNGSGYLTGTQSYFPFYDGNGNVAGLTDSTGNVAALYDYDPFGNLLASAGSPAALAANPFRFSTKYFDSETGLYYYGYRYYDPQTQRWLSRDPIAEAGGTNLYAFVQNDPVNQVDAVGLAVKKGDRPEVQPADGAELAGEGCEWVVVGHTRVAGQTYVLLAADDRLHIKEQNMPRAATVDELIAAWESPTLKDWDLGCFEDPATGQLQPAFTAMRNWRADVTDRWQIRWVQGSKSPSADDLLLASQQLHAQNALQDFGIQFSIAKARFVSEMVDTLPYVGWVKGGFEAASGENLMTGDKVGTLEAVLKGGRAGIKVVQYGSKAFRYAMEAWGRLQAGRPTRLPKVASSHPALPERKSANDPTHGIFNDQKPLISGRDGGRGPLVFRRRIGQLSKHAKISLDHVEGHAAAELVDAGLKEGVLHINYKPGPCPHCVLGIPELLGEGQKLWVVFPDGVGYFTSKGWFPVGD